MAERWYSVACPLCFTEEDYKGQKAAREGGKAMDANEARFTFRKTMRLRLLLHEIMDALDSGIMAQDSHRADQMRNRYIIALRKELVKIEAYHGDDPKPQQEEVKDG